MGQQTLAAAIDRTAQLVRRMQTMTAEASRMAVEIQGLARHVRVLDSQRVIMAKLACRSPEVFFSHLGPAEALRDQILSEHGITVTEEEQLE